MRLLDTDKAQAVLFFGDESVSKELLYPELEALLDNYVPMHEWIDTQQRAVYLEFDYQFCPTAAVFFTMEFNTKGHVDAAWNLPLVEMARTANKGPDFGAGPIHLACAQHCPIAYFENWMWDPDLNPQTGHFQQIKTALKRNRLGLHFTPTRKVDDGSARDAGTMRSTEPVSTTSKEYVNELRDHLAQLLKDQQIKISELSSEREKSIKEVQLKYVQQIDLLQRQLQERDTELTDVLLRNHELKATVDGQVQKIEGLREYFEHKLQRYHAGELDSNQEAETLVTIDVNAKIEAATKEINDILKMKEVELSYRQECEEQLQHELNNLKQLNIKLTASGGAQILEELSQKGVNFVTYQPGVGHITIPIADIAAFLQSPSTFTAAYCGVSEEHYAAWLKHFHAPVCIEPLVGDEMCAVDLTRVSDPKKFVCGENDHCVAHNHKKVAGQD